MAQTEPFLIGLDGATHRAVRLPKSHEHFDEQVIQELLVKHPELLPVAAFRPDVGELVCIGREVSTAAGSIDNLYLSTAGYVVVVETKLWGNPQSRREVLAQVLDYVKDVVSRDYAWLESVWTQFCKDRGYAPKTLLEAMRTAAAEELDEGEFVDRVHRVIERGDVVALIVGDGIETRLQQLVSHLCRDSAHLRYSLGLIALRCYQMPATGEMLVLPEVVQEVQTVERSYVRIELAEALAGQVKITSITEEEQGGATRSTGKRITLSEDDLYDAVAKSVGQAAADRVRRFVDEVSASGIEASFKSANVMLKIPDPNGESDGASLLAIGKSGGVYNPDHGRNHVMKRWAFDEAAADRTIGAYWRKLNAIDKRFSLSGIPHSSERSFIPLKDLIEKLDAIHDAMKAAVADVQRESETLTHLN